MAALCGGGSHNFAQPSWCRSEHLNRCFVARQPHLLSARGRRLSRGACRWTRRPPEAAGPKAPITMRVCCVRAGPLRQEGAFELLN